MISQAVAIDPTHRANDSEYFTHDEYMIVCGSILSGPVALVGNPESVGTFTDSFITDRALIWDKMVVIFQGLHVWKYLKPYKRHSDGRMGYKLIYNHYLGTINIDHMAAGVEKKISQ